MVVSPPPADAFSTASYIWTVIDSRIQAGIKAALDAWGRPRSRTVTMNIPLGGLTTPALGWLTSVGVAHDCKIVQWSITALAPGSITVDLRVTTLQTSPSTVITPVSILNGHFLTLFNGYTTFSSNTSNWTTNQISGDSVLHVYVQNVNSIAQALLVLRLADTTSKTISR